jgi:hypothetical protein
VRLQIEIGLRLRRVVDEDVVHGHIVGPEMVGAVDDAYLRKVLAQTVHDRHRVGIDQNFIDFRNGQQGFKNVVEERLARQETVILARHALAVVAHRDEGD